MKFDYYPGVMLLPRRTWSATGENYEFGFNGELNTDEVSKKEWAYFIKQIADKEYPKAKKITLVMDNFKTHTASAFYETFEPKKAKRLWDRFEFVYTPKHGSWLNMAEIELPVLNG